MSEAQDLPGWSAPVYEGLQEPVLLYGVPHTFFILNALVTLMVTVWWVPALLFGGLLYGLARLGTAIDPDWGGVLWEHARHRSYYEG